MNRRGAIAVVTAAGLGLGGCGSAALQTARAPAPATPSASTVIFDCSGQSQVRPRSFILYCADANAELLDITWRDWGHSVARGHGVLLENSCLPNCAAGRTVRQTAQLTVSGLALQGTDASYSELHVDGAKGSGLAADETFSLTIDGPVIK